MICYRDMTFCRYYTTCQYGSGCPRARTKKVIEAAENFGLPVSVFGTKPKCYTDNGKILFINEQESTHLFGN
jgi:hypothetical protein